MSTLWARQPLTHIVLEAIKRLAQSDGVVLENSLKSYLLEREGIELSPSDLARVLMILEKEGYISVQLSTKDERIIKLRTQRKSGQIQESG